MDKMTKLLENKITPLMDRLNKNKIISALKSGAMFMTPFVMIGGFALVIMFFPGLEKIAPNASEWLKINLGQVVDTTINLTGLVMLVGISYAYSKEHKIDTTYGILIAIVSFLIVTVFSSTQSIEVAGVEQVVTFKNVIPLEAFGAKSIITAIIVGLLSVRIFSFIFHKDIVISMPDSVPPLVTSAFTSILPALGSIIVFTIIRMIFLGTSYESLTNFIYTVLTMPLLKFGDSIWSFVLVTQVFANFLWFFGIHGTNVVGAVWTPILQTMGMANLEAFQKGLDLPYIISSSFNSVYGICNIYAYAIAMIVVMKSKRMKSVAKIATVPAAFCISEPIIFALPVFMNPILFIPYMIVSSIQFIIVYYMCRFGLAPVPVIPIPWTTPAFINVLLSTNWDWSGVLAQLIIIVVGVLIWIPFMKVLDNKYLAEEAIVVE